MKRYLIKTLAAATPLAVRDRFMMWILWTLGALTSRRDAPDILTYNVYTKRLKCLVTKRLDFYNIQNSLDISSSSDFASISLEANTFHRLDT